jgi:uncharacterized protein YjbJ (UPF0337 family)
MVSEQALHGHWNEIKGKLRERWGQLTDDDLERFSGNVDKLAGLIERKTGAARSAVVDYLEQISEDGTSDGASVVERVAERVRQGVGQAVESVHESSAEALDYARDRYDDANEMVRQRPSESVLVCFGVGVAAGLLVGLLLRRR